MPDEKTLATAPHVFACCFTFDSDRDLLAADGDREDEGNFQILVEAHDVAEAAQKCRERLHEIAQVSGSLGGVVVYADAFVELTQADLVRGLLINHVSLSDVIFRSHLPEQGEVTAKEHFLDDDDDAESIEDDEAGGDEGDGDLDDEDEDGNPEVRVPVFWAKWKLYWCETGDHDEDWFVVARASWEAASFHEDQEGYDDGDADAEFICVLPDAIQLEAEREETGWPSDDVLKACGAEFVAHTPNDGCEDLRAHVGSGDRIVRIGERLFCEGDLARNVIQRLGGEPDA